MAERPFLCPKCGNWYIKIPLDEGVVCWSCSEGKHAVHPKNGVDCHFEHESATPSEVRMAKTLEICQSAKKQAEGALPKIAKANSADALKDLMVSTEQSFASAERAQAEVGDILKWSGVMEMPGMAGEPNKRRFLGFDAIESLVEEKRRPQTDKKMLQRSMKVCAEMANDITAAMASARVSLGQARKAAENWSPAEPPSVSKPDGFAKARAAKAAKLEAAKAAKAVEELVPA